MLIFYRHEQFYTNLKAKSYSNSEINLLVHIHYSEFCRKIRRT